MNAIELVLDLVEESTGARPSTGAIQAALAAAGEDDEPDPVLRRAAQCERAADALIAQIQNIRALLP